MPTIITAQNGEQVIQNTKITVTGCSCCEGQAVDARAEAQAGAACLQDEVQGEG